jgi:hypothetical protein
MSYVTVTRAEFQSLPFFLAGESIRKKLVILANLILAIIGGGVFFFNTYEKKPHEADNIYAVSIEGAII